MTTFNHNLMNNSTNKVFYISLAGSKKIKWEKYRRFATSVS